MLLTDIGIRKKNVSKIRYMLSMKSYDYALIYFSTPVTVHGLR